MRYAVVEKAVKMAAPEDSKERKVMSDQMIKLLDAVINVIREIKAATQKDGMSRQAMVDYLDHMINRLEDIRDAG